MDSVAEEKFGSEDSGFERVGMCMFVHWAWRRCVHGEHRTYSSGKGSCNARAEIFSTNLVDILRTRLYMAVSDATTDDIGALTLGIQIVGL